MADPSGWSLYTGARILVTDPAIKLCVYKLRNFLCGARAVLQSADGNEPAPSLSLPLPTPPSVSGFASKTVDLSLAANR